MYRISQFPRCGLGNKILYYNALVQESTRLGMPFCCCYDPDLDEALDISFDDKFEGSIEFPFQLGDNFFRNYHVRLNDFLKPKEVIRTKRDSPTIAVHFRGKDYHSWKNGKGILPSDYYIKAFVICLEEISYSGPQEILHIDLHTDDTNLESYKKFTNFLKSLNSIHARIHITYPSFYGSDIRDWQFMCQADYIISAPSTFSITAGAVGKKKKIVHSKDWINWRVAENDQFWCDLTSSLPEKVDHEYKLWRMV